MFTFFGNLAIREYPNSDIPKEYLPSHCKTLLGWEFRSDKDGISDLWKTDQPINVSKTEYQSRGEKPNLSFTSYKGKFQMYQNFKC